MRRVKPTYEAGVVLVCGNQRAPDADKPSCGLERGTALRGWLKDRIKAEGLKGKILSSRTTCLGVCSARGVTVDIVPTPGHGERRMLLVDPEADREALWAQVKACLLDGTPDAVDAIADEDL
jgi:hypothetical protein